MKLFFSITSRNLTFVCPGYSFSLTATSGRNQCLNNASKSCQIAPYRGPIPAGHYYINPKELSDPGFAGDLLRNFRPDSPGDWGDWRIRIYPKPGTKTWGRDNFFIHGGSIEGSAGCIDIGGGIIGNSSTDRLLKIILSSPLNIDLEVTD